METKAKIEIDLNCNYTKYFYGTVEQEGKELPFTIIENHDCNTMCSNFSIEWVEETPHNKEELETQIMEEFNA